MVKILPIKPACTPAYTDVEYVEGLLDNRKIQEALYKHWERYFETHGSGEFFHLNENKRNIVHNSFKVLWNKVRTGMIYVEDGILKGKDGQPFSGSLTTYMMGVAKLYNKELVKDGTSVTLIDDLKQQFFTKNASSSAGIPFYVEPYESPFADNPNEEVYAIVSDILVNMSERCSQILTMFYCDEKKLDIIMEELNSFNSKDALKTAKNKCLKKLKTAAKQQCSEYYR